MRSHSHRTIPFGFTLALSAAFLLLISSLASAVGTADVELTKTSDAGAQAVVGQTVTFTVALHNFGPNGATQIHIEDTLDANLINITTHATVPDDCSVVDHLVSCDIQGIGNNGDDSLTITAQIAPSTPPDTVITNCAEITDFNQEDPELSNNSDCADGITVTGSNSTPTALELDREGCTNVASPFCAGDPGSVATISNVNRVFSANELMRMDPTWTNNLDVPIAFTGTISGFTGPGDGDGHATYHLPAILGDATADYGTVAAHGDSDCNSATGDCYTLQLTLDDPANRPAAHWDTTVLETLSTGETKTWTLHIGDSFGDVLQTNIFYRQVETIYHNHIALGCLTGFCPELDTRRDEMAAFVARSVQGSDAQVPVTDSSTYNCVDAGSSNFADIAPTSVFCRHTNFLLVNGISIGCGSGNFCPEDSILRSDAAIFVARGMNVHDAQPAEPVPSFGTDGAGRDYNCDTINDQGGIPANTQPFPDVLATDPFCAHVGFLWVNHVVNGDINGDFRPGDPIRRDETATVLSNAFVSLPLYGPLNP